MDGMIDNAAPPSATPPAGSTVSSGTASEAMIRAATAASSAETGTPATGTPAAGTPAASGVAPAETHTSEPTTGTTDPLASVPTGGEAPPHRIEAAVRNARAEVEAKYAWAKDFSPSDVKDLHAALGLVKSLRDDPAGFYAKMGGELTQRGLMPAARQEAHPTQVLGDYGDIEADLHSPDGKMHAYSDGAVRKMQQLTEERVTKRLLTELSPLIDFYGNEQNTRAEANRYQQAAKLSGEVMGRVRQLPHFKEHEAAITETLKNMDPAERQSMGVIAALYHSYSQVLAQKVFPTIATTAEQTVRDNNQRKLATSQGTIHPTQTGGGTPGKVTLRGPQDLATHMAELERRLSA